MRAESRTLRLTTCPADSPPHPSPASGAIDTRPRDGLRPNRPHCAAGIRIEPPPSVACARGGCRRKPPPPRRRRNPPASIRGPKGCGRGRRAAARYSGSGRTRARAAAHEHETRLLATRDVGGLVIGDKILEQAAAEGRRLTGLKEAEVLDKVGHTLQGPFGEPRCGQRITVGAHPPRPGRPCASVRKYRGRPCPIAGCR